MTMEGTAHPLSPAPRPEDIAAAFGWWREAGVDLDFTDDPAQWLAAEPSPDGALPPPAVPSAFLASPADRAASAPVAAATIIGGAPESWPQDFAAFADWWMSEPSLDMGRVQSRVPPRGAAGADLLVIVPQPEPADSDRLLSGHLGSLLSAMLSAMGVDENRACVISTLPRAMPLPDWEGMAAQGLGALLRHAVGLAAPRRIVAFGSVIPPLLGHDPAQKSGISPAFNHHGTSVPLLAARDLAFYAAKPAAKARLWQQWLDFAAS